MAVGQWDNVPQALTGCLAAVPHHPSDNLAGAAAQHSPDPAFIPAASDKRPPLIHLQHIRRCSRQQGRCQVQQLRDGVCYPAHNRLATDMGQALQSAQVHSFLVRLDDQFSVRFRWRRRFQNPIRPTIFAMVLRTAAFIRTISDDVNVAAVPTRVRHGLLDHVAHDHHSSLTPQPLPNSVCSVLEQ